MGHVLTWKDLEGLSHLPNGALWRSFEHNSEGMHTIKASHAHLVLCFSLVMLMRMNSWKLVTLKSSLVRMLSRDGII